MNNNPIKLPVCHPNTVEVRYSQTTAGLKQFKNCLVNVTDINTTFFVDNQRRITQVCAMPIFVDGYDYQMNPLGLRCQVCYDFIANRAYVYNGQGKCRIINLEEA